MKMDDILGLGVLGMFAELRTMLLVDVRGFSDGKKQLIFSLMIFASSRKRRCRQIEILMEFFSDVFKGCLEGQGPEKRDIKRAN